MKINSLIAFLMVFTIIATVAPSDALAIKGGDDNHSNSSYSDDWDDEDEDEDEDEDLEIEADIFTDTTIVKVELENGKKETFTTDADSRAEIIEAVAKRFNIDKTKIDSALEVETEDRASRANERAKISGQNNRPAKTCVKNTSDDNDLEIEADIFTDTTIVKVELENGRKSAFKTSATTTDDIIDEIMERFDTLTESEIEDVIEIETEDRASRTKDLEVSSNNSSDDCDKKSKNDRPNYSSNDDELKAKIAQLQRLIELLIELLNRSN